MIWQLHNLSHKLPEELKLNQGSTFRANLYWHRFTASSEATAINTYWVYALRFTKCLFFFVLLILKQTIKPAGLFYLLLLFLSTKIVALAKNIGGFHMNTSLLTFSFSIHPLEEPSAAPRPQRQSQQIDQCDTYFITVCGLKAVLPLPEPLATLRNQVPWASAICSCMGITAWKWTDFARPFLRLIIHIAGIPRDRIPMGLGVVHPVSKHLPRAQQRSRVYVVPERQTLTPLLFASFKKSHQTALLWPAPQSWVLTQASGSLFRHTAAALLAGEEGLRFTYSFRITPALNPDPVSLEIHRMPK